MANYNAKHFVITVQQIDESEWHASYDRQDGQGSWIESGASPFDAIGALADTLSGVGSWGKSGKLPRLMGGAFPGVHPLVGKLFHSFGADGGVHWQGQVLAIEGDTALVRTFSWLTGVEWSQETVPLKQTEAWQFYDDEKLWRQMGNGLNAINARKHASPPT